MQALTCKMQKIEIPDVNKGRSFLYGGIAKKTKSFGLLS